MLAIAWKVWHYNLCQLCNTLYGPAVDEGPDQMSLPLLLQLLSLLHGRANINDVNCSCRSAILCLVALHSRMSSLLLMQLYFYYNCMCCIMGKCLSRYVIPFIPSRLLHPPLHQNAANTDQATIACQICFKRVC